MWRRIKMTFNLKPVRCEIKHIPPHFTETIFGEKCRLISEYYLKSIGRCDGKTRTKIKLFEYYYNIYLEEKQNGFL